MPLDGIVCAFQAGMKFCSPTMQHFEAMAETQCFQKGSSMSKKPLLTKALCVLNWVVYSRVDFDPLSFSSVVLS